ncbi:MAG: putative RND superfamily exporter protein [Candidatus Thalassarchaeaceae archaeon]|jgi:predicted RND superfamily exporter protein|tara:strand:+ start:2506 stop:5079 length:2574 start_codon:yes stop_codon:yes gene_type:complete
MAVADQPSAKFSELFERMAFPIVVTSLFVTLILATFLSPLPTFSTDLSSFAPDTGDEDAKSRIYEEIDQPGELIYINVETIQIGSSVLEIGALKKLSDDYQKIDNYSKDNGNFIKSQLNAADIINRAILKSNYSGTIHDFDEWGDLLNSVFENNEECSSSLINDGKAIASASFASSVMLNEDFNFEPICDWLESGTGNPLPHSSSTLWIIEMSGDLGEGANLQFVNEIRNMLSDSELSESNSPLTYGVISDSLVSNDINEATLDDLVYLFVLAIILVVFLLAITFRSFMMVAAPLLGLSASLVWTYGIISMLGIGFTILEVAVAPVVLGLGIDYCIHLQRGYEKARSNTDSAAKAWIQSFMKIRVALTLAVITTVFAFLANSLSPLPPLQAFGFTLALGVISAFVASTVTVGALHVVVEKTTGTMPRRSINLDFFAEKATNFQKNNTARVLLLVALITTGSVIVAQQGLDTSFELTDFLSEDEMEIMEVRNNIYDSYEVDALKSVYILIEPNENSVVFEDEEKIISALRGFDQSLLRMPEVVSTEVSGSSNEWPSYDSLYLILKDMLFEDETFGYRHNLELFGNDIAVTEDFQDGDLSNAVLELLSNDSIGDQLRGFSWADRSKLHVSIYESIDSINKIDFLTLRIDVEAESSTQVADIAREFGAEIKIIEEDIGGRAYIDGDLIVLSNVLSSLISSIVSSTGISLAVSFAVLVILTRRFGQSLVVILPVGLAGSWVVGAMAILGINWNVLTVMITALTIGLGIDYSIHVWRRFEENRRDGMDVWSAMRDMYATTGASLLMSAGTTICGFSVLLLSPVPVIQDFGIVSSISVAFSLILALLVLPGLLASEVRTNDNN